MKNTRNIGLVVFLVGFVLFIASLFIGTYKISEEKLKALYDTTEKIDKGDTIVASLKQAAIELKLLDKEFDEQFSFSSNLTNLISKSNASISNAFAEKEGITTSELEAIYDLAIVDGKVAYSKDLVIAVFFDNSKKQKLLIDNTSWMFSENKSYDKVDDFKKDFENKLKGINGKLGEKYFIWDNKYSRFDLVKASLNGPITDNKGLFLFLTFGLCIIGALMYILPGAILMGGPGIKNNGVYHDAATKQRLDWNLSFCFLIVFLYSTVFLSLVNCYLDKYSRSFQGFVY